MNDEPVKKTMRLDFGKKNQIDQAAEDAIDESIAPLAPSTLTSALEITEEEADKFDDTAPDPEPIAEPVNDDMMGEVDTGTPEPEIEHVPNAETVEALEAVEAGDVKRVDTVEQVFEAAAEADEPTVDQAEGMEMTDVPTEVAETGTLDEITLADDAARETDAAEEDNLEEMEAEKQELEEKITTRKEAEKQHVCGEIVKVMQQYTVDIDYLAAFMGVKYKRRGSKAKPKYRDPMTGKTWSGRGKTPVWIRNKDKNLFLI